MKTADNNLHTKFAVANKFYIYKCLSTLLVQVQ